MQFFQSKQKYIGKFMIYNFVVIKIFNEYNIQSGMKLV